MDRQDEERDRPPEPARESEERPAHEERDVERGPCEVDDEAAAIQRPPADS